MLKSIKMLISAEGNHRVALDVLYLMPNSQESMNDWECAVGVWQSLSLSLLNHHQHCATFSGENAVSSSVVGVSVPKHSVCITGKLFGMYENLFCLSLDIFHCSPGHIQVKESGQTSDLNVEVWAALLGSQRALNASWGHSHQQLAWRWRQHFDSE